MLLPKKSVLLKIGPKPVQVLVGQTLWRTEVDPEQSVEDSTEKIEKKSNEKGTGRMPWLQEAMKDVASCDKPRGEANIL